jgi:hypothetical protein
VRLVAALYALDIPFVEAIIHDVVVRGSTAALPGCRSSAGSATW